MNKLSKAQQDLVDKMREGWVLKRDNAGSYLIKDGAIMNLFDRTVNVLLNLDVIAPVPGPQPPYYIYQLTEKYRSNEK